MFKFKKAREKLVLYTYLALMAGMLTYMAGVSAMVITGFALAALFTVVGFVFDWVQKGEEE